MQDSRFPSICPLGTVTGSALTFVFSLVLLLVSHQQLDRDPILLALVLRLSQEVDLLFASEEVSGALGEHHDGVGELVAEQPGLQRPRLAVDNVVVAADRHDQAVHLREAVLPVRIEPCLVEPLESAIKRLLVQLYVRHDLNGSAPDHLVLRKRRKAQVFA